MISVILYGRNDSHGYNLHKRGALSLNCIAEVLKDDGDELIFVDYNTPDELPTFPEAIADTLTDHCKSVLRTLRVRPSFHRRFASMTRLVALESQSRNIAIRRTTPQNRWVLSTNTDMIFCPQAGRRSLGEVAAELPDGFFHLPRFEVPEGFWERLDRLRPQVAIERMQADGYRFHLNEVVFGSFDNIYEGPGDFQLFLREDLFRVNGFDERMILGWHADSNMARRMKLLRGEVLTAFGKLSGYHCGHTRQATSLHKGIRTENDSEIFVRDVSDCSVPTQSASWGAPDEEFEEIRLRANDLYFPALAKAVPTAGAAFTETAYNETTYNRVTYTADHVLPHLCDLFFNLSADQSILYVGDDDVLPAGLERFLVAAERRPRLQRWSTAQASRATTLPQALAEADVVVLQHPSAVDGVDSAERSEQEWHIARFLQAVAVHERDRPLAQRKRVVVVNGIHNGIGGLVEAVLAPTTMPFSSRLRQGVVVDEADAAVSPDLAESDRHLICRCINGLIDGSPLKGWQRLAPEILRELEGSGTGNLEPQLRLGIAALAGDAVEQALDRAAETPVAVGPRTDLGVRLCSGEDWADPRWLRRLTTYFNSSSATLSSRTRWSWERASILHALSLRTKHGADPEAQFPKVLLISPEPDLILPAIVHLGYDVTYATPGQIVGDGEADPGWALLLQKAWLPLHRGHRPWSPQSQGSFKSIVVINPVLNDTAVSFADVLRTVHPQLAPGAKLIAGATVQLNELAYDGGYTLAEWRRLFDAVGPLGALGLAADGDCDFATPWDTVIRFAAEDDPGDTIPGLSSGFVKGFNTVALVCATTPETLGAPAAQRLLYSPFDPDMAPYSRIALTDGPIYHRLGRRHAFDVEEVGLLKRTIEALLSGEDPPGWRRLALELEAIAEAGALGRRRFGVVEDDAAMQLSALVRPEVERARRVAASLGLDGAEPRNIAGSRVCSGQDWDDPRWAQIAFSLFGSDGAALSQRQAWMWSRTSIAVAAKLSLPPGARVLLVANGPDAAGPILVHLGYEVFVTQLNSAIDAASWQILFESNWLKPTRSAIMWRPEGNDKSVLFDAVVFDQGNLFGQNSATITRVLKTIHPHVKVGGSLIAIGRLSIGTESSPDLLSPSEWRQIFDTGVLGASGLAPVGEFDQHAPLDTLVRTAEEDAAGDLVGGLSFSRGAVSYAPVIVHARWPRALTNAALVPILKTLGEGREPPPRWVSHIWDLRDAVTRDGPVYGLSERQTARILGRLETEVARAKQRSSGLPVGRAGARGDVGTRLCSPNDWEDPSWRDVAQRLFGVGAASRDNQSWIWQRATVARNLERSLPRGSRVLVVAEAPDHLSSLLAHCGFEVFVLVEDTKRTRPLSAALITPPFWMELRDPPKRWRVSEGGSFDAQVALGATALRSLVLPQPPIAGRDLPIRAPIFCALTAVSVGEVTDDSMLSNFEWRELFSPAGLLGARGLTPLGRFDPTVPLDTLLRCGESLADATNGQALSIRLGEQAYTWGVINARVRN